MPTEKKDIPRRLVHPNRYPWSKARLKLLGKMPDVVLARRMGIHPTSVSEERRRRQIPAFRPRLRSIQWTRQMESWLGTDFDWVIAERLGLPTYCVTRKRQLLGIIAYGESLREGQTFMRARGLDFYITTIWKSMKIKDPFSLTPSHRLPAFPVWDPLLAIFNYGLSS